MTTKDPLFAPAVSAIAASMRNLLREAVVKNGPVRSRKYYADGFWVIEVLADGRVANGGYAQEARGAFCSLEDLSLAELAELIATL